MNAFMPWMFWEMPLSVFLDACTHSVVTLVPHVNAQFWS